MIDVALRKDNTRCSFRYNGYIHCVVVDTGNSVVSYAVTKEQGNTLYKELIAEGFRKEN